MHYHYCQIPYCLPNLRRATDDGVLHVGFLCALVNRGAHKIFVTPFFTRLYCITSHFVSRTVFSNILAKNYLKIRMSPSIKNSLSLPPFNDKFQKIFAKISPGCLGCRWKTNCRTLCCHLFCRFHVVHEIYEHMGPSSLRSCLCTRVMRIYNNHNKQSHF